MTIAWDALSRATKAYLKFNPLPLVAKAGSVYAGRPLLAVDGEYYRKREGEQPTTEPRWQLGASVRGEIAPPQVNMGDLVEVTSREGAVQFGVVTWSPVGSYFDMINADGQNASVAYRDVTFALKDAVDKREYDPQDVTACLRAFVGESVASVPLLLPYLRVAYAQLCLPGRARAVDISEMCRRSANAMAWYRRPPKPQFILATYLSAAYYDLNFVRFDRGDFLAIPPNTADAIAKIMNRLTPLEFNVAIRALLAARAGDRSQLSNTIVSKVLTFLVHYATYGDVRLSQAVRVLLEALYPKQNTEWYTDPASVHHFLHDIGSGGELFERILGVGDDGLPAPEVKPLEIKPKPVVPVAFAFAEDIAASIDESNPGKWVLQLHVPALDAESVLKRTSTLGVRTRTVTMGTKLQPLFGPNAKGFLAGDETPVLTFSSPISPWAKVWKKEEVRATTQIIHAATLETSPRHRRALTAILGAQRARRIEHVIRCASSAGAADVRVNDRPDFEAPLDFGEDNGDKALAAEARLLAGEWAAAWAETNNADVPYVSKPLTEQHLQQEKVCEKPEPHDQLGLSAYVPVGHVFDFALPVLAQRQVLGKLGFLDMRERPQAAGPLTALFHSCDSAAAAYNELVAPNARLAAAVETRCKRYATLQALEHELQRSDSYCLFRCRILEPARGGFARAACADVEVDVEVLLADNTEVAPGDTVVCTEIVELNPVQGTLVVA